MEHNFLLNAGGNMSNINTIKIDITIYIYKNFYLNMIKKAVNFFSEKRELIQSLIVLFLIKKIFSFGVIDFILI